MMRKIPVLSSLAVSKAPTSFAYGHESNGRVSAARRSLALLFGLISGVLAIALPNVASAATVYTGILEPGDAIFAYDGSLYDDYAIQGEFGTQLTVQLQSNEFDPFLALIGPQGEWLLQNNDISNIDQNSNLAFTFPDDQVYYLFVNAYDVRGEGAYQLHVSVERIHSSNDEVLVPLEPNSMPHPQMINVVGLEADAATNDLINDANGVNEDDRAANPSGSSSLSQDKQQTLVAVHNRYRAEVDVPDLEWSDDIARSAQEWADHLATTNSFGHSSSSYGENLWTGTAGAFSLEDMVSGWGEEKEFFIANAPFPNVSTTGNWADVGHYTQIVWRDTTEVGCAIATGSGRDTLVCQYNPPGNYQGEMPF